MSGPHVCDALGLGLDHRAEVVPAQGALLLKEVRTAFRSSSDRVSRSSCSIARRCWMVYSTKSLADSPQGVREPLAGARVQDIAQAGKGDLSNWVELMEAVEALCPTWPAAPVGVHGGYRL